MNPTEAAKFEEILGEWMSPAGRRFSPAEIRLFSSYYGLVRKWNKQLPLTTLISPRDFAERHIFESAFAVECLHESVREVWDMGAGLGVPGVPLSILKPDLRVHLVESNRKKSYFLEEVLDELGLGHAVVCNMRIESVSALPRDGCVTMRAVEKMSGLIPTALKLGVGCAQMLIFCGAEAKDLLESVAPPAWHYSTHALPGDKRMLVELTRST